jgi:hypothetical protein
MKSLICKEVLGTRTYSGANNYTITRTDVPDGTKRIMVTFTEMADNGIDYVFVTTGQTNVLLNSKNLYYFDWIWSNTSFNLYFGRSVGNINNLTVVYLR